MLGVQDGVEHLGLAFGQVRPAPLGPTLLRAEPVNARAYGDARDPVCEGHFTPILRGVGEHLHKYLLRQIFLVQRSWQVRPDDLDDERVEMLDQRAGGVLITLAHARQAHRDIQAGLLTHKSVGHETSTGLVTRGSVGGYGRDDEVESRGPLLLVILILILLLPAALKQD